MMLITILLMIEDQRDISCANNACYVHISFLICDGNACKTNSVIYFNVTIALSEKIALLLHPHVDVPYSLVVT